MLNFTPRQRFLLYCAGVDIETMSECTSAEANRYMLAGATVLIPCVLSIFTTGYSVYLISKSIWVVALFTPIWLWVIFTLDRAIVANISSGKLTGAIVGRIILALFISVTISQPFELLVFNDVINQKFHENISKQERLECRKIDSLMTDATRQMAVGDTIIANARKVLRDEVNKGGSESKRRSGYGEVARFNRSQIIQDSLIKIKKDSILLDTLKSLKIQRVVKCEEIVKNAPRGLVGQLETLYEVEAEHPVVLVASLFTFLLLLTLEIIPIYIKLGIAGRKINVDLDDLDLYNATSARNSQTYDSAQKDILVERKAIIIEEQLSILHQRKTRLIQHIKRKGIEEVSEDYEFYMDVSQKAGEKSEQTKSQIIKRVKDEIFKQVTLANVLKVYFEFSQTLKKLIDEAFKMKQS